MTSQDLRAEIRTTLNELRALRDEARVKIHLASMDARTTWERLQPKIAEAEQAAENVSQATLESIRDAAKKLRELVKSA